MLIVKGRGYVRRLPKRITQLIAAGLIIATLGSLAHAQMAPSLIFPPLGPGLPWMALPLPVPPPPPAQPVAPSVAFANDTVRWADAAVQVCVDWVRMDPPIPADVNFQASTNWATMRLTEFGTEAAKTKFEQCLEKHGWTPDSAKER
jgi:hypothetical protein